MLTTRRIKIMTSYYVWSLMTPKKLLLNSPEKLVSLPKKKMTDNFKRDSMKPVIDSRNT